MAAAITPGTARPCGRSLTLGFRKPTLFEGFAKVAWLSCGNFVGCTEDVLLMYGMLE